MTIIAQSELGQIRFMNENLLLAGYNTLEASSTKTGNPLSNLINNIRTKAHKFTGRFLIDSTNNSIYFNDGANKTATIASSSYTSPSSFATAIQTALNAVSSGFTVTYLGSFKFKITRNATWTFRLSQTANAAHETMGFMTIVDTAGVVDGLNYSLSADEQRNHYPNEYYKVDFGYSAEVGFIGMIGDLSNDFGVSENATVRIQANDVDLFTGTTPVDETLSPTKLGLFKFIDTVESAHRFWKITITDIFNPSGPEIPVGILALSEITKFNDRYHSQGHTFTQEDRSDVFISEGGQVYRDRKAGRKKFSNVFVEALNKDNKDFIQDLSNRFGQGVPFFICFDPNGETTNNLEETCIFGRFSKVPEYTHLYGDLHRCSFEIEEVL
jgi:hypothetical protein